jgi:hypothetical protein
MALDLPTAIANALAGIAGVAKPYIDASVAQKYENECKDRLAQWVTLLTTNKPDDINAFVLRLVSDAGQVAGGLGEDISVSLDVVNALIAIACNKIKDDELLANIQFTKIEGTS